MRRKKCRIYLNFYSLRERSLTLALLFISSVVLPRNVYCYTAKRLQGIVGGQVVKTSQQNFQRLKDVLQSFTKLFSNEKEIGKIISDIFAYFSLRHFFFQFNDPNIT